MTRHALAAALLLASTALASGQTIPLATKAGQPANLQNITNALSSFQITNPANWITAAGAPVQSVAGRQGSVVLTHADLTDWGASMAAFLTTVTPPVIGAKGPVINLANFSGIDPTGSTISTGFINAVNAACLNGATLFFPGPAIGQTTPAIYRIAAGAALTTCPVLHWEADRGTVELLVDPSNTSVGEIVSLTGSPSKAYITGFIFDGNVSNNPSNTNGLLRFNAPIADVTLKDNVFQNTPGNPVWLLGGAGVCVAGTCTATMTGAAGQTGITLSSAVPGLGPGAAFFSLYESPWLRVQSVSGASVTMNGNLGDTLTNSTLRASPSFQNNAVANIGDLTIYTSSTANLGVGMVVSDLTGCLPHSTHILSIAANASVNIDQGPTCQIPVNTGIGASSGIENFVSENNVYQNVGQQNLTSAAATYATAGDTPAGSITMTFNCITQTPTACTPNVGLLAGNLSAASPGPAGLPAGDLIASGPVINYTSGTYAITLKTPTTADIPAGTSTTWSVHGGTGTSYAIAEIYGGNFANRNFKSINDKFSAIWSAPMLLENITDISIEHDVFDINHQEFYGPSIAPSPCIAPWFSTRFSAIDITCIGPTGSGIEAYEVDTFSVESSIIRKAGASGISIGSGRDVSIVGNSISDSGQAINYPIAYYGTFSTNAITLNGSAGYSSAGTLTGININGNSLFDDQASPTQAYGVAPFYAGTNLQDISIPATGNETYGNLTAGIHPSLLPAAASQFTNVVQLPATLIAAPTPAAGGIGYAVGDTISLAAGCSGTVNGIVQSNPVLSVASVTSGAVATVTVSSAGACAAVPPYPIAQSATSGSGTGATFTPASGGWGGTYTPPQTGVYLLSLCGAGGGAGGVAGVSGAAADPGAPGAYSSGLLQLLSTASYNYIIASPGIGGAAGNNAGVQLGSGLTKFGASGSADIFAEGLGSGAGSASGVAPARNPLSYTVTPLYAAPFPMGLVFTNPLFYPGIATLGAAGGNSLFGTGGTAGANANGGNATGYCAGGGAPAATSTTALAGGNGTGGLILMAH